MNSDPPRAGAWAEPVTASVLAAREAQRRDGLRARGACSSGCRELDDYVLGSGGFERGSIVGVSAEDEEGMGLALALETVTLWLATNDEGRVAVVTPRPAAGLAGALGARLRAAVGAGRARVCLERVRVSRVFDMDGLDEALDDDDVVGDDVAVVLVTHASHLVRALFAQRPPDAAREAVARLACRLRRMVRVLAGEPLVLLLNSTTTTTMADGVASTTIATAADQGGGGDAHHPRHHHHHHNPPSRPVDPTLGSIFSTRTDDHDDTAPAATPARPRPSFGLVFAQLLDLHLLCTRLPVAAGRDGPPGDVGPVVVEVLLDHLGLWQGRCGPRPSREQRWALVDVVDGRVVDRVARPPP